MSKKVVITGGMGLMGSMIAEIFAKQGFIAIPLSSVVLDITSADSIKKALDKNEPDIVINCASYTNVDKAESEVELSNLINGFAAGFIAKECMHRGVKLIHMSSDYVFGDNNENGHTEEDNPNSNQINQYGKSKRLGELDVMVNNINAYIVRTSWAFGPYGKNFVDTIINIGATKKELNLVVDEVGVPTYTKDIAEQLVVLVNNMDRYKPGFYHIVSEGACSRYEEAEFIFNMIGLNVKLHPIKLKDFGRSCRIPNYSILLNMKLPSLHNWKDAVKEYLENK